MSKLHMDSYYLHKFCHFLSEKRGKNFNKGGGPLHNLPTVQRRCNFLIISGHFWVPLCYEPSRYRVRKKIPFITENGYYFNFEVNFLKRVHPYGSKNIFPQTFHLKGPWV